MDRRDKMKQVLIKFEYPPLTEKNFEDLLATDDLFVEYFNAFMELPTFPEPLCFNKASRGFEVVTTARKKLASEIKAAVRAGRLRKRIYRATRDHSFSDIPLIPMEDPPPVAQKEIDTSFTVQTLNKEQGIEWVKAERLPVFLKSDCYMEYRLAKLLSQAEIADKPGQYVSMKIDYTPPEEMLAKIEAEEKEKPKKDDKEVLMQDLFVCMGSASTTQTDSWVSQATAKSHIATDTTQSSSNRPISASAFTPKRPHSARLRPKSAVSMASSHCLSGDSGIWSLNRSSAMGSTADISSYASSVLSTDDEEQNDNDVGNSRLFDSCHRRMAPRPKDQVCVVGENAEPDRPSSKLLYQRTDVSEYSTADNEGLGGEIGQDPTVTDTENALRSDTSSSVNEDTPPANAPGVVFKDLPEMGRVITGTILKEAIQELSDQDKDSMETCPEVQELLPEKFSHFNSEMLNHSSYSVQNLGEFRSSKKIRFDLKDDSLNDGDLELTKPESKEEQDKDSDEDSLLNSDDDYEEDRDAFFRRLKKRKTLLLTSKKEIEEFKKFLEGTIGEKSWLLWTDIERAKTVDNNEQLTKYMAALRERYQKYGAPYEISQETKVRLGLTELCEWTVEKLASVQDRIVEPLILYWAPRFLIREQKDVNPDSNVEYQNQQTLKPKPEPYPNPPTIAILPLRPKSCMPRIQPNLERKSLEITDLFESISQVSPYESSTSRPLTPPIGKKRTHPLTASKSPPKKKEEKKKQNQQRCSRWLKTPKQLISASLEQKCVIRPGSAPVRVDLSGPKSAKPEVAWETSSTRSASSNQKPPSRPSSARSNNSADSEVSQYLGGRRMEGLLQALASEKKAGGVIRKQLQKIGNQLWKNCLDCWEDLQTYHRLFYSKIIDPYVVEYKAKAIYSRYVVEGAPHSVQCNSEVKTQIRRELLPPYEELFDSAEERVLYILFEAWTEVLATDITTFGKVELIEIKRHLDTKSKYVVTLKRRGIIKERPETPEEPSMEYYHDPVYDESLLESIPEEFKDFTLDKLVHNRIELEHFRQFLADNYASMDLLCWMDIEAYRRISHVDEQRRDTKAKEIKNKYFNKKYFFGPNSPAGKDGQDKVMALGGGWGKLLEDRLPTPSMLEAQKYVTERLEKKWLPLFLTTDVFAERQRPRSGMDDVVEDVMIQRKKKSQAIWKMLESKWVSSSKDIITFRKALMNPVSCDQFRRFVSIKGDNFENDVLFWQEVQNYKGLCHLHSDRSLIHQKTLAIIHCFIDSPIPPSLQIDITQEMADKIVECKMEATPYLFREAQLTVFRVLFSHWTNFSNYRSNLAESKILPTIERHRKRERLRELRKHKEQQEKKEREINRRKVLGLPPDDEEEPSFDPFEKATAMSVETMSDVTGGRPGVSWSYSQYLHGLDHEEVLNEVDHSTFASLSSHEGTEDGSVCTEDIGKTAEYSTSGQKNKEVNSSRNNSLVQHTSQKVDRSEIGSQTQKFKKMKPTDTKPTSAQNGKINGEVHNGHDVNSGRQLSRGMPPLVAVKK